MLSCHLRFLEIGEDTDETPAEAAPTGRPAGTAGTDGPEVADRSGNEDKDEVQLSSDEQVKDYLLESLSSFGLVEDIQSTKFSSKSASFSIRMARHSEALRAAERLNGTSLHLGRSLLAIVKASYNGPRGTRIRVTYPSPLPQEGTQATLTAIRRRFACCGPIHKVDLDMPSSIVVSFEDVPSALRAFEDFKERGGLSDNPTVDFTDEEKKRHRVPSEAREEATVSSSSVPAPVSGQQHPVRASSPAEAAAKRSRDVVATPEGLTVSPKIPNGATVADHPVALVHIHKDTKRSRDVKPSGGASPPPTSSATTMTTSVEPTSATKVDVVPPSAVMVSLEKQPEQQQQVTSTIKRSRDDIAGKLSQDIVVSTEAVQRMTVSSSTSPPDLQQTAISSPPTKPSGNPADEGRQLFVVHAKTVAPEAILALFQSRPGCETIDVKRTKRSGVRGMTFVTFTTREQAQAALEELHGKTFPEDSDQQLKVLFAQAWDESKRTGKRGSDADAGGAQTSLTAASNPGETNSRKKPAASESPSPALGETSLREDTTRTKKAVVFSRANTPSPPPLDVSAISLQDPPNLGPAPAESVTIVITKETMEGNQGHGSFSTGANAKPRTQRSASADRASMTSSPSSFISDYTYASAAPNSLQSMNSPYNNRSGQQGFAYYQAPPFPPGPVYRSVHQTQPPIHTSYPPYRHHMYTESSMHHHQIDHDGRTAATDALAETFGNVMAFTDAYLPHPGSEPYHPYGHPHAHPYMQSPAGRSAGPSQPAYIHHHALLPPQVSPTNLVFGSGSLPDASRLHVAFRRPLPEHEVHRAFDMAAPGLQYVSRHADKPYAFVKYASTASAMVAMVKLHNSVLCGQKLRVTLADPPPPQPPSSSSNAAVPGGNDFSSRKRQRDVTPGAATQKTSDSPITTVDQATAMEDDDAESTHSGSDEPIVEQTGPINTHTEQAK